MIITRITGGLGNQLFQYAAALALASRHGAELGLDLSYFSKGGVYRDFGLTDFAISGKPISGATALTVNLRRAAAKQFTRAVWSPALKVYYARGGFGPYDPAFAALPDGALLWGDFQSESYFAPAGQRLRHELHLQDRARQRAIEHWVANTREAGKALVSVQIRRTDMLDGIGGVPLEITREAMARFPGANFAIFSDDLDWCRAHIKNATFSPFTRPADDMVAMSLCDHHIIANSTFGWWGAWLNPKPDKIVIAPANWFPNAPGLNAKTRDLYPANWIRL